MENLRETLPRMWAALLALGFAACIPLRSAALPAPSAQLPRAFQEIDRLEDARIRGDLVEQAHAALEPSVRARAFLALARLQDADTAADIGLGLKDADPSVRATAAFAAMMLGLSWEPLPDAPKMLLVSELIKAEGVEQTLSVRVAEVRALGRLRTNEAREFLAQRLSAPEPLLRAEAALSLGLHARGGDALSPEVLQRLSTFLSRASPQEPSTEPPPEPPGVRFGAAYALAASHAPSVRSALLDCLSDSHAPVRAACARGLGDAGVPEDASRLGTLLELPSPKESSEALSENVWGAVEATRSLAKLAEKCAGEECPPLEVLGKLSARITAMEESLEPLHAQVLLALAQQGLPARGARVLESLRARLRSALERDVPGAADFATLDCRFAAALDRLSGALVESPRCGGNRLSSEWKLALGLRELARSPVFLHGEHFEAVLRLLDSPSSGVQVAAVEALGAAKVKAATLRIRALISSTDPVAAGAAAAAAGALGDGEAVEALMTLALRVKGTPDLAEPVAEALVALKAKGVEPLLRDWLGAPHAHVRLTAAKALRGLSGQPVHAQATTPLSPRAMGPEAARVPEAAPWVPAPDNARLRVVTSKGEFILQLDTGSTPRTSANLYRLAQQGFFDGLTFHRVVPGFVVQGGDPRGDGNGGPGYTFRCEASPRTYTRGTVGMALSGKDTGGSQFFVATTPQPHLDGRYTAWGEVVEGFPVVERLLEGEVIQSLRPVP